MEMWHVEKERWTKGSRDNPMHARGGVTAEYWATAWINEVAADKRQQGQKLSDVLPITQDSLAWGGQVIVAQRVAGNDQQVWYEGYDRNGEPILEVEFTYPTDASNA